MIIYILIGVALFLCIAVVDHLLLKGEVIDWPASQIAYSMIKCTLFWPIIICVAVIKVIEMNGRRRER